MSDEITKKMKSHKDLDAWKKSMDLVDSIYKITKSFPNEELYSLTNQMRRAAVSVPSNIAEGAARGSKKEFVQFLRRNACRMNNLLHITYYVSHITLHLSHITRQGGRAESGAEVCERSTEVVVAG